MKIVNFFSINQVSDDFSIHILGIFRYEHDFRFEVRNMKFSEIINFHPKEFGISFQGPYARGMKY